MSAPRARGGPRTKTTSSSGPRAKTPAFGGPRAGRRGRPGHAVDEERAFSRSRPQEAPRPAAAPVDAPRKRRAKDPRKARDPKSDEQKAAAKEARELNGGQLRYLRGLGHHLDPVVHVGKEGVSDTLVKATKEALLAHELVKVKVLQECPVDRKEVGPALAERSEATLAQILGRTLLLYRRHPNKPKITLPRR